MTLGLLTIRELCRAIGIQSDDVEMLADSVGTDNVIVALTEAKRAGDSLYSPAAFVAKRARQLRALEVSKENGRNERLFALDREVKGRERERAEQVSRVQAETILFATLNAEQVEELRSAVLAALPPVMATGLAHKAVKDSALLRGLIVAEYRKRETPARAGGPGPH